MDKDPANVIPVEVMFDIQKMIKKGFSQDEILKQFNKKNMNTYIKAYIERLAVTSKNTN
ncbi:MAG: hypothetical protein JXM74_11065 [Fusobacteriaceae bacterium]|nr:hypothetical protein [Fusobacteriaceae bacterium]